MRRPTEIDCDHRRPAKIMWYRWWCRFSGALAEMDCNVSAVKGILVPSIVCVVSVTGRLSRGYRPLLVCDLAGAATFYIRKIDRIRGSRSDDARRDCHISADDLKNWHSAADSQNPRIENCNGPITIKNHSLSAVSAGDRLAGEERCGLPRG